MLMEKVTSWEGPILGMNTSSRHIILTTPLPPQDDNQYLYSLFSPGSSLSDFLENQFLQAVEEILANEGFDDIAVELHGIYEDGGLQ